MEVICMWVQVRLLQGYKFAIVTENTNAFDYVTEKLFQALLAGTVPVYMGMYESEHFLHVFPALWET
jgi:hypothetical protein